MLFAGVVLEVTGGKYIRTSLEMSSEVNAAAGAAHHVASEPLTPTAYIAEHLQNLNNIGGPQT